MGKIDARALAQAGFRYLGRSYQEMDCQGFVERCLADCGNHTDLSGSNSWFRECLKNGWVGTPEECRKEFGNVPVGAFLFILEAVSSGTPAKFRNDGIGDATHMGIVTGNDKGAIHSSKSRGGVCESEFHGKTVKNGGWNRVGLWMTEVDYHVDAGQSDSDSGLSHGGTSGGACLLRMLARGNDSEHGTEMVVLSVQRNDRDSPSVPDRNRKSRPFVPLPFQEKTVSHEFGFTRSEKSPGSLDLSMLYGDRRFHTTLRGGK